MQIYDNIMFNGLRKVYPDGTSRVMISDRAIFREPGWEDAKPRKGARAEDFSACALGVLDAENAYAVAEYAGKLVSDGLHPEQLKILSSRRKARTRLRDICRSTSFKWFVTLTLDAARVDRYDVAAIVRRLNVWLDNRVRRRGLAYVLVPEHHKDGAIHFHGFFNDALDAFMVPSGKYDDGGHAIYNCEAWDFGFTTAIQLYGDYTAAVAYVCKYIGKEEEKVGGRWYYSGGALGRPRVERFNCEYAEVLGAYEMEIDALGAKCLIMDFDADGVMIKR